MISVILTTYNAERFVLDAVRSILEQTYRDLECVVVDDGSTDGTLQRIQTIDDPRLRVVAAGRLGRGRALNLGLRASRGQYIAVQDADDVSHPQRLEIELAALERQPDLATVGTGALFMTAHEMASWPELRAGDLDAAVASDVSGAIVYGNPLCHSSLLSRRSALEAVHSYDERRTNLYDYDLLVRLVAAQYRLGRLPCPLVARRLHKNQYFERRDRRRYVHSTYLIQRQAKKLLQRGPALELVFIAMYGYRLLPYGMRSMLRAGIFGRQHFAAKDHEQGLRG